MCEFQSGTYECRGDGYLWDADCDGYDPRDHSMACPKCNTKVYLLRAKEEAESTSYYSDMSGRGSGVTIWENSVSVAMSLNKDATLKALPEIGCVEALYEDPNKVEDYLVKKFTY